MWVFIHSLLTATVPCICSVAVLSHAIDMINASMSTEYPVRLAVMGLQGVIKEKN